MTKYARTAKQRTILWLISLIILTFFLYPMITGLTTGVSSVNHAKPTCETPQSINFCIAASQATTHKITRITEVSSHITTQPTTTPSVSNTSVSRTPTTNTAWNLVWSDDFSSPTLDTTKWTALDGGHFYTPPTSENYAPDDTYIQPGQGLIFKSEKRSYNGYNYTSGGVSSRGKFSFLYGKLECREQLPQGKGLWPAIWLMPANGSSTNEIDLLELVGSNTHDLQMNYHWLDASGNRQQSITHFTGADFSADYHTFDLEWTPNALIWSIDGSVVKTVNTDILSIPMFLYINTAIGANGTWPGLPDSTTSFPQYTKVSYVRVYKAV